MKLSFWFAGLALALVTVWPAQAQEKSASLGETYRHLFKERMKNIERLRNYHQQGKFPRNYDFPTNTPYFVDVHGTHCAMAELVKESGAVDVVSQVVKLNNNIYVNDVKSGPFFEWMLRSGLTQEECARIQPTYRPRPKPPLPPAPSIDPDDLRVLRHLASVEAELQANTLQSLKKAMVTLRSRSKHLSLDKNYAVVAAPVEKTEKVTITLKNMSRSKQVALALTFFNDKGEIVRQELPKFYQEGNAHVLMMAVGQELTVTYNSSHTWVVVEWTAGPGLNITVPFLTVADVKPSASAK